MADDNFTVVVDPGKKFQKAIDDALEKTGDLTIPFTEIAKEWFQGNKAIFSLKGHGKWDDLSDKYKKRKKSELNFVYPMFRAKSGKLEESLVNPKGDGSVNQIINKTTLILGTSVKSRSGKPYPIYLQAGTKHMPARPFVLIGAEQTGPPEFNKRVPAFIAQIENYLEQIALKEVGKKA